MTLRLDITTPEANVFSDDVDMVVVPGIEGELGILPQHIPLMTTLKPGALKVTKQGHDTLLAVGEGFVEVLPDRVSVLTDMAIEEKQIDEVAVEAAIERARQAMREPNLSGEEIATVEASLRKSLVQLRVKRRQQA